MALILTETAAGYALFKARDKKLLKSSSIEDDLSSPEAVASNFKIKAFAKFESAASALQEANAIIDGKVSEKLSALLKEVREDKKTSLVVADTRLGNSINKIPNLSFNIISDSSSLSIYRALRENLASLLTGLDEKDLSTMSLGLAHSLGRHKLKFSADKVDTMIVQAISLLDDLDKELNTYAMRIKEWYGWHFPEMAKIVADNVAYARVVKVMGMRSNASTTDLSHVLPEEVETQLKDASEVSMGTEISRVDLENMQMLADQVIDFAEYREQLATYLSNRMAAIAPNLTALVGDLVGARLISHSGSLMALAKAPASTIQILGAEKALFRALKTKHDTPKYGLLYHSSLIGQATGKNKGKIARMLAAKAAVSLRYDALAEELDGTATVGLEDRIKIEKRLSALEGRDLTVSRAPASSIRQPKIEIVASAAYNEDADVAMSDPSEDESEDEDNDEDNDSKKRKVEQESAEDKRRRERRESKDRKRERKERKAEEKKLKEVEKQQTSKERDEKRAQKKKEKEERRKRKREE